MLVIYWVKHINVCINVVCVEVLRKLKYMFMSREQNAGQMTA
jgi:hypothetical protein